MRATLEMKVESGKVTLRLDGPIKEGGALQIFAEDGKGQRRALPGVAQSLAPGNEIVVDVPAGAKKLAAVVRGRDAGDPFVAAAELALP